MTRMNRLGVIFDVDGTLVDSNDQHARAWVDAFAEHDLGFGYATVRPLIGMGGDKLIHALTGWSDEDPRATAIADRRGEIFTERWLPEVRPLPGARELLAWLRESGAPVAIATAARKDELEGLLALLDLPWLLDVATSADDAERSKPDPDIVTVAIARLGLPPTRIVMVGDTPYDVEAATRAGIRIVALRSGGQPDRALAGAIAICDGPHALRPRLEALASAAP